MDCAIKVRCWHVDPRIGRSKSLFGVGKMGRHFDFQISQYLGASHVCRNAPVIALWNRVFGSTTFAFYVDGDPNFHQLDYDPLETRPSGQNV